MKLSGQSPSFLVPSQPNLLSRSYYYQTNAGDPNHRSPAALTVALSDTGAVVNGIKSIPTPPELTGSMYANE